MQHSVFFKFAGHDFEAKVVELDQTIELDLENVIQDNRMVNNEGSAKAMVLREGLKALYRDKQPQNLRDNKGVLRIPPIRDPETREGLINPLLRAVVWKNDFLGYVDPFKSVFEGYLPGEEENPTETEDTSQSGSITSLPTPPHQATSPSAEPTSNIS